LADFPFAHRAIDSAFPDLRDDGDVARNCGGVVFVECFGVVFDGDVWGWGWVWLPDFV
jgi:hypothetical protein